MKVFALQGPITKELISWQGVVLVHDNKPELEWLFPKIRVVEVEVIEGTMKNGQLKDGRAAMSIKFHPEFEGVRWDPLRKSDFVGFSS